MVHWPAAGCQPSLAPPRRQWNGWWLISSRLQSSHLAGAATLYRSGFPESALDCGSIHRINARYPVKPRIGYSSLASCLVYFLNFVACAISCLNEACA